jgi:CBS-domain-containing membrane protein
MGTVADIMNPKLLYIRDGERLALARGQILRFGVTAVPILDDEHRPVGVVSLRDLSTDEDQIRVSSPVVTVRAGAPIEEGARALARTDLHHLVVVDDQGVAVGMASAVDFLRALLKIEPRHPAAFAGY